MAFQRIRIKNTNVSGKIPGADKLDVAELCVNLKDHKLFSKDADGNVFEIAGGGAQVPGGDTPPSSGNEIGDLFFDTTTNTLLYWDGTQWVPIAGDEALELDDLADVNVGSATDGQVLIYDKENEQWIPGDIGLITGDTEPTDPKPGDIWVDTGDCPPTINIWDDCDDPGNPTWKPIGGGGGLEGCSQTAVSIISSNGSELNSTLTALGGTAIDVAVQQSVTYEWTGAKAGTAKTIVADVEGDYTCTVTLTCTDGQILRDSDTFTIIDTYVEMTNKTAPIIAIEGTELPHDGNYVYVATAATVDGGENPVIDKTEWFIGPDTANLTSVGTGDTYTIKDTDTVGDSIYCKQTFKDDRGNEIESDLSNPITIVERPADAITFTAAIFDDGTSEGNQVGKSLTAVALNIVGGTAPIEYEYQWYANNVPEAAGTGDQKVKEIISTDIGKVITCDITVAEPDGSNPEMRTAVYNRPIVDGAPAVEIAKPEVLSPANGAGSGGDTSYFPETSAIKTDGVDVINIPEINYADDFSGSAADPTSDIYIFTNVGGYPFDVIVNQELTWTNNTGRAVKMRSRMTTNKQAQILVDGVFVQNINADGNANGVWANYDTEVPAGSSVTHKTTSGSSGRSTVYKFSYADTGEQLLNVPGFSTTTLTFENDKAFDSADGTEMSTIDKVFKAGDKVVGKGDITVFADSPCFSTTLYTGTGTVDKPLPTGINNTTKSLVWIKDRDANSNSHMIFDTERASSKALKTDKADKEIDQGPGYIEFLSDGVNLKSAGTGGTGPSYNYNGARHVAWNFRGAPGFFDVVTYEGDGVAGLAVPHSLGSAPGMIIVKSYSHDTNYWTVYHKELGSGSFLKLDQNQSAANIDCFSDPNAINSSPFACMDPTANEFYVGSSGDVNFDNYKYVAYLFADTPGLIKCGKYSSNTSAPNDPITVNCGFKPGWVMIKLAVDGGSGAGDGASNWVVVDNKRTNVNGDKSILYPDSNNSENAWQNGVPIDFNDSGFVVNRSSFPVHGYNYPNEYIYVAIAENASAGQFMPTGVLTVDADKDSKSMTLTDVTGEWMPGFTAVNQTEVTEHAPCSGDIQFLSSKPETVTGTVNSWGTAKWTLNKDLGGGNQETQTATVQLQNTDPEQGPTTFTVEDNTQYSVEVSYSSSDPASGPVSSDPSNFQTCNGGGSGADGNFSTTIYTGNDTFRVVDTGIDNTGKALIWTKARTGAISSGLFDTERGVMQRLSSDLTDAQVLDGNGVQAFNNNGFTCNPSDAVNGRYDYVAWNFAAAEGFFDVVQYDGTGSAQTIPHDLKVAPGMFVCKRIDSGSNWVVYHKGVGNEKTLQLNGSSAAGSPSDQWWNNTDPTDTEFSIGSAPAHNTAGGKYVAYLFADNPDEGIKCGKHDGNGVSGTTVDVGFKPGWVLYKSATKNQEWYIYDTKRLGQTLIANLSNQEAPENKLALTETGFRLDTGASSHNEVNSEYVYVAIADSTVRFYDENTNSTVTNHTLTKRYGVDPLETDLRKFGIYPLTEQPNFAVDTYVKEGDYYNPVRDYTSEINAANAKVADLQSRLASLEADEVNDDATDTLLLNTVANLLERVEELEGGG